MEMELQNRKDMTALETMNKAYDVGITPAMLHVALVVLEDGPCTPRHIAKKTGMSSSWISSIVKRMQPAWLRIIRDKEDRRTFKINATPALLNMKLI